MRTIELPYSGEVLLSHLAAYGVLVALRDTGVRAFVSHPPESLTCEPRLHVPDDVDDARVCAAVRATAVAAEEVVETDMVLGAKGNDRRSIIWARGSYANDPSRAEEVVRRREALVERLPDESVVLAILAGLGCPATWGGDGVKPAHGATGLDGVLGNHTSDLVRGVLRPARAAASTLDGSLWNLRSAQDDKTGWSPPGTRVALEHQWLAVLGLALLPVAHRPHERSHTPATWDAGRGRRGIVLPLFATPTSLARARAIVGLTAMPSLLEASADAETLTTGSQLRALGIAEVMAFDRLDARGAGTSVAFTFRRGRRIEL